MWGKEIITATAINVSAICMLERFQITLPLLLFTPVALYRANGSNKFSAIPMAQGGCHLSL